MNGDEVKYAMGKWRCAKCMKREEARFDKALKTAIYGNEIRRPA
jgi:hypothetical protein